VGVTLPLSADNTPSFVTELLYRLKVRDVMTRDLITAHKSDTLRAVQDIMKTSTITGVPVAEGKRMLGIISMDDIIRALDEGRMHETAEVAMTRNVIVLEDDMPLAFALSYMEKYRFGRFPVLSTDGELVGIITSRDIIVHLILAMNQEMETLEEKLRIPQEAWAVSHPGSIHQEFATRRFDFENAGKPSAEIKRLCKENNLDPKLIRRIAVASYELEMNQVIHSLGGSIIFALDHETAQVIARDTGPGIPDIEAALSEGFSTANEWVRTLGFGAGMGLPNTKRVADEFSIQSTQGIGTTVHCTFKIKPV